MSSFQYEKTQNIVSKKKELISAKKYLLAKDGENQKYAVFHLINNYKETVNKIVLIINQYDNHIFLKIYIIKAVIILLTFASKTETPQEIVT